jgi:hypothetical protein
MFDDFDTQEDIETYAASAFDMMSAAELAEFNDWSDEIEEENNRNHPAMPAYSFGEWGGVPDSPVSYTRWSGL